MAALLYWDLRAFQYIALLVLIVGTYVFISDFKRAKNIDSWLWGFILVALWAAFVWLYLP